MQSIPEINFEELSGRIGNLGIITLNRPQVLNALNHAMFVALAKQITEWEGANHIKAIIIRAEGRAFCAGGDVRQAYEFKQANNSVGLIDFFRDEYFLNRRIFHCSKPYVALLNGITMGGGAGISIHGSHRVATENVVFAMPETTIGFYPDVGGSYFLSRLPYKIGIYLGLTGARITHQDCLAVKLVDQVVDKSSFPEIIYKIADADLTQKPNDVISTIIEEFAQPNENSELWNKRETIKNIFSKNTIEEILASLETSNNEWEQNIANVLKTKSPTSLKVTLLALQKAVDMDFDECMQMEYDLTMHFIAGHDFFEGVRALLVEKDNKPHWQPAMLAEVSDAALEKYFVCSN